MQGGSDTKPVGGWLRRHRRAGAIVLGAFVLVAGSYLIECGLHRWALRQVDAGKAHVARADWLAAIGCFDRALQVDRSLSEVRLLRATAINDCMNETGKLALGHTRDDALADLDRFLKGRPNSGEALYQKGLALAGRAKVKEARDAFAQAIPLLADPSDALVDRAGLSFHVGDHAAAVKEISAAIERHPFVAGLYESRALYRRFVGDPRGARHDEARAALLEASKDVTLEDLKAVEGDGDRRPIAEAQDSPAVTAERTRFLGTWKVVAQETEGKSVDTTDRDYSVKFDDRRYTLVLDGNVRQNAPFRLDPRTPCGRIDWSATIGGKPATLLGIYAFQGETLKICMGNLSEARPVALATGVPNTATLYVLRPVDR